MEELEELRVGFGLFELCGKFGGEIVIGSADEVPAVLEGVSVSKRSTDSRNVNLFEIDWISHENLFVMCIASDGLNLIIFSFYNSCGHRHGVDVDERHPSSIYFLQLALTLPK